MCTLNTLMKQLALERVCAFQKLLLLLKRRMLDLEETGEVQDDFP